MVQGGFGCIVSGAYLYCFYSDLSGHTFYCLFDSLPFIVLARYILLLYQSYLSDTFQIAYLLSSYWIVLIAILLEIFLYLFLDISLRENLLYFFYISIYLYVQLLNFLFNIIYLMIPKTHISTDILNDIHK